VKEGIDDVLGKPPEQSMVSGIKERALEHSGVVDVHDIIIHQYGQERVMSLHVAMDEKLSFREAHELGSVVGEQIDKAFHAHTTIHLDPVPVEPLAVEIKQVLTKLLDKSQCALTFYDLRLDGEEDMKTLHLHMRSMADVSDRDAKACLLEIETQVKKKYPFIQKMNVELGPKFLY
jgi:hypothetical protein